MSYEVGDKLAFGHVVTERDRIEDFSHENGQYQRVCCICKQDFFGHKRRFVCKVCYESAPNTNGVLQETKP